MKILKFTNADNSLDVEYTTDLIGTNEELTVYQIEGLDSVEEEWGLEFRRLPYVLGDFIAFATTHNLRLDVLETGVTTVNLVAIATAFAMVTTDIDDGDIGVVDVQTITIPATSGAAQGDYILITNWTGETVAVWLDIDADGTEPTGAKYLASDYQIRVPIITAGTTEENGTLFYNAITVGPTIPEWTIYVGIADQLDGDVIFTQTQAAVTAAADPENTGDTGVGSITVNVDTTGTGTGKIYAEQIEAEGGNTPYSYALTEGGDTDLPAGLTFNTTTGILEGVATAAKADCELDVTVTDAFGIEVLGSFDFETTTP